MKIWSPIFVLVFLIVAGCGKDPQKVAKSETDLPKYHCQHISREIPLTGKLDDPLWEQAASIYLNDAVTGKPGRYQTEVKALYSDEFFYVRFCCEDEYCWGTVTERDGPIWNEECVEVFLNPANTIHQYYELNVSPRNVVFDACVLNSRTAENPTGQFVAFPELNLEKMQTAVWIDGELNRPNGAKDWCAVYAIPFSEMWGAQNIPPQKGDSWRINFYRIDSPTKEKREHYSWTHIQVERFHLPWLFGYLIFE